MNNNIRRNIYRIAAVFTAVCTLNFVPAPASAQQENVYLYEDFNSYPTNESETKLAYENSVPYVADMGGKNKGIRVKTGISKGKLSAVWDSVSEDTVIAFDIKESVEKSAVDISVLDGGKSEIVLISADADGNLKTYDGKRIGGIGFETISNIALRIDSEEEEYDVFVNGRCVLSGWYLPKRSINVGGISFSFGSGAELKSEVYLDNVRAYSGTNVNKKFSPSAYNDETIDIIELENAMGNTIITRNDFESIPDGPVESLSKYCDVGINLKGNLLTKKTEGNKGYIEWEKNLADDMHMDKSFSNDLNYLVIQADFRFGSFGATVNPFIMRDNVSGVSQVDEGPLSIDSSGKLTANGSITVEQLKLNKWYNIAIAANFPQRTYNVYLDGKLKAENVSFRQTGFKTPRMVRIWAYGSLGVIMDLDNYFIYEAKEPVENLDEIESQWVSIMSDGTRETAMLSGKTAISIANGITFVNNKREKNDKPDARDGDYYVSRDTAAKLLGELPQEYDGSDEIPLKAAAEKVGLKVYENESKYLLIFSENEFQADDTLISEVSTYMKMAVPAAEDIKADFERMNVAHPRVVATSDMWDNVKELIKNDEEVASWHKKTIARADSLLNKEVDYYHYGLQQNILSVARYFKEKMEAWGYAWRTTGDRKYADAAWAEFKSICEFPDWDPTHILDTGELLYGSAIGYDWMYDAFTDEQRKTIEEATLRLGIQVVRSAYYGKLHTSDRFGSLSGGTFVCGSTNFNVVANGGMTAACVAFGDVYPEECFDGISKAIQSLGYMLPKFEPDGAWEEGPNYWDYTTQYLARMVSALETSCGTDYTILSHPGVNNTPYYAMYLDSYQGINNFSDSARGMQWNTPQLGAFGKYMNEKAFTYMRYAQITERSCQPSLYDILWFDESAKQEKSVLPLDNTVSGLDMISIREDWDKSDSLYLGAHGGKNNVYHAQYDGGSYVFDLLGERWAVDLGMDDATYVGNPASSVYRGRAEGHNMLVFNPDMDPDFILESYTPLTRFESKPKGAIAVYDNSQGYSKWCSYVTRGFYVGDERRSMTVRDEFAVNAGNEPTEVYWNMQTPADIEIDGHKAILTINGKKLQVEVSSNAENYELLAMKAEPLPGTPNPDFMARDKDNKLVIKLLSNGEDCYIEVKMSALGEKAAETGMINQPIADWTLPDGELIKRGDSVLKSISADGKELSNFRPNLTKYTIGVLDGNPMPQITAASDNGKVEIKQAESTDDITVITAYDAGGNFKTVYNVEYKKLSIPADVFGMTRNVVYDLQVSSTPEEANFGANMLDGDLGTRWASEGVGESAIFDLGSVKDIDAFAFAYEWGDQRHYSLEIEVSEDGEYYVPVWSGVSCGYTDEYEKIELDERVKGRYVKLIGNGNTTNNWNGVREFAILTRK